MRVLITGSTGLIGTRIIEMLGDRYEFVPLLQSEVDITDGQAVDSRLWTIDFDVLLHLAAYTNVDGAEKEKELCRAINVDGTRNLFEISKRKGAKFIYISTDMVFDGKRINSEHKAQSKVTEEEDDDLPVYTETSVPNPISQYGQTKYEAEVVVKGQAMIVRLSYPYRKEFEGKRDFVRTIKYLLEQGKTLYMVQDSLITPTFVDDFVNGLDYLIQHYSTEIFHLVGADSVSPYEAGKLIARNWGLDENLIQPTTYEQYFRDKAPRPQWARIAPSTKAIRSTTFISGLHEIRYVMWTLSRSAL